MIKIFFLLTFMAIVSLFNDSYAVETITGYAYFDTTNPDGSHTWQTHNPYILDNGNYVPFVSNGYTTTANIGTVTLNPDGSFTWDNRFTDRIISKYSDVTDQVNWTYPDSLNNNIPDLTTSIDGSLTSTRSANIGVLEYKYILIDGKWKTQLEATNLSPQTTKVFGFDQIIDLNSDTIRFGGIIRNLDNFDGQTFDKQFLENNEGKVLDLLNGINFDFDLGFDNLHSITIHDTGINSSQLVFDYRTSNVLLPNDTLIIDPTFSTSTANRIGSTSCTTTSDLDTVHQTVGDDIPSCYRVFFNYDVTSIPDTATITDVDMTDTTGALVGTVAGCNVFQLTTVWGVDTREQIWDDSTTATHLVNNDSFCSAATTFFNIDLGATADSSLDSWIGGGEDTVQYGFEKSSAWTAAENYVYLTDPDLVVTYITGDPPDAVDDLTSTSIGQTTVDLSYTEPGLNSGTLENYLINATTPQTANPTTFILNTTSITPQITGLNLGTAYSIRVSALTENGYNATGNVLNVTTLSLPPPESLGCSGILNGYDCNWTAINATEVTGYYIAHSPDNSTWAAVNVTSIGNVTTYLYLGFGTNETNYIRVNATGGGQNSTSTNHVSSTTWQPPDAVTDLIATVIAAFTVDLSWSEPDLHNATLSGYQINYTTPWGDPVTIITNDTGTSDTTTQVSGLTPETDYSFRVAPWTDEGTNATGNILNVTTLQDFSAGNFTLGGFDLNGTNPDIIQMFFERQDINDTALFLNVTFPNTYNLACDFSYEYANINQTYTGMNTTAVSVNADEVSFLFDAVDNEIIDVYCWDQGNLDNNGDYLITQTSFVLLEQISNFRNGTYGTSGEFGAMDLITMFVIIISMIGFNRVNESVGAIFNIILLGSLAYFEVIELPTIIFGAIAVVLMLVITSTRKT